MDVLKQELLAIDNFDDIVKKMISSKIVNLAKNFLNSIHANIILKPKDFLTAFMIYKFPEDVVGSISVSENRELINASKKLVESSNEEIKKHIVVYNIHFKTWKNKDLKTMKEQLFNEYHQLGVDIANTEDHDKKHVFEITKNEIMKCAKNIGGDEFVEEIQSYAPVLINKEELESQFSRAFFDLFSQEFNQKKYDRLEKILDFIKNTLLKLNNQSNQNLIEEYLDVEFIIQRFKFDLYNDEELENLSLFIFDMIKNIQSAARDEELNKCKEELKNRPLYFPGIIVNIMHLIRMMVIDLENLKQIDTNSHAKHFYR